MPVKRANRTKPPGSSTVKMHCRSNIRETVCANPGVRTLFILFPSYLDRNHLCRIGRAQAQTPSVRRLCRRTDGLDRIIRNSRGYRKWARGCDHRSEEVAIVAPGKYVPDAGESFLAPIGLFSSDVTFASKTAKGEGEKKYGTNSRRTTTHLNGRPRVVVDSVVGLTKPD